MFVQLTRDFLGRKAGERIDVSEADGKALLANGTAQQVEGDPLQETISKALSESINRITGEIGKTVDETLKEFAKERSKSLKNQVPAIFGPGGKGDPRKTFGQFLLALRTQDHKALEEMGSRFAEWETKDLGTTAGASGGYTVPTEFLPQLLELSAENAVVEPRATRIPMTTTSLEVPALDVTTAPSAGDTAFFGGLNARWTAEAASMTQDEPVFKSVKLTAYELSGYTLAANALLQDNAVGLEALLLNLFGRALGWHKDRAFLRGTGSGQPLGMLNAAALISVSRSASSAFALVDAAGMLGRMLPGYNPRTTVWAIHPTVLVKLIQMPDAEGNVVFIDNARQKPTMMLFGIPVQVTEKLPALNTLGDVLLLDCQHYLVGDRQDVEIAFSEHYKFINNQGTWRFVARCDGQPWLKSAVTLSDASNTLSPFVGLAAA